MLSADCCEDCVTVAVPVPGPSGRDGVDGADAELTPEAEEHLAERIETDLTPPVDLVLLFNNSLV